MNNFISISEQAPKKVLKTRQNIDQVFLKLLQQY
jgi:hypothetical protein